MFIENLLCIRPALGRHGPSLLEFIVRVPSSWLPYIEPKAALVEGNQGNLLLASAHRPWKVGWGSRRKDLCFRQGRELHYESPGTPSRSGKKFNRLKKGRETREGGASIRSCRTLNAKPVTCPVSTGWGVWEALKGEMLS